MQEFYINKNSTLPILKMELVNDGRNEYHSFYEAVQGATITFSMENTETGVIKISNAEAILLPKDDSCEDSYYIAYKWTSRDTRKEGKYSGKFTITFSSTFGGGTLIVPIQEELIIYIQK